MAVTADQERVKTLLTETIILLCKNGLHFKDEFTVEGLIGITIDKNDVFLINIKETVRPNCPVDQLQSDKCHIKETVLRKRKRHSRSLTDDSKYESDKSGSDIVMKSASYFSNSTEILNQRSSKISASLPTSFADQNDTSPNICKSPGPSSNEVFAVKPEVLKYSNIQNVDKRVNVLLTSEMQNLEPHVTHFSRNYSNDNVLNITASSDKECILLSECEPSSSALSVKIKEEIHEVEELNQCQFLVEPGSFNNQNAFNNCKDSTLSAMDYSLVDSSLSAYSSLDPQTFQLCHNVEQTEQQVELLPGSGVYISMRAYIHLNRETWVRGSKLVRRVVREVFPDEHILARSSCLGRRLSGCHVGLDHHKVDTIKAFVQQRMPQVSHTEIVAAINECCRDIRAKLRKSYFRSANSSSRRPV